MSGLHASRTHSSHSTFCFAVSEITEQHQGKVYLEWATDAENCYHDSVTCNHADVQWVQGQPSEDR